MPAGELFVRMVASIWIVSHASYGRLWVFWLLGLDSSVSIISSIALTTYCDGIANHRSHQSMDGV